MRALNERRNNGPECHTSSSLDACTKLFWSPLMWNGLFSPLSLALCTCRCMAAPFVLIDSCLVPQTRFFYSLSRLCYLGSRHFRHCASVCVFTLSRSSLSLCFLLLSRSILLHSSSISGQGGRPCSCCSRHLSTWTHGCGLASRIHAVFHNLPAPGKCRIGVKLLRQLTSGCLRETAAML